MENSDGNRTMINAAKSIVTNPLFLLSGWLLAIVAIILAVIFYFGAQEESQLVYAINPARTSVVTAGQATELEIFHQGIALGEEDIMAAQVAIWNTGDKSIRQINILKDIVIYTQPAVPILEAKISKLSRDVTEFTLHDTPESLAGGRVPISWYILETNDGASIQLIYIGAETIEIHVDGVIEEQGDVQRVDPGVKIESPSEQVLAQKESRTFSFILLLVSGILICMSLVLTIWTHISRLRTRNYSLFMLGSLIPLFGISLWFYLSSLGSAWPPFGF